MNRIIIYLFLCLSEVLTLQNQQRHAVVRLEPNNVRISKASGIVRFSQKSKNSPIKVTYSINNLQPNSKHGFHIHQFGDLSQKCQSLGTHYNPFNKHHGGFDSSIRHVGDFGNLIADKSGNIYDSFVSDTITLFGQNSIIGRSVVLHEKEDDLGKGNDIESLKTGNAGGRFACGVIGLAKN